MRVIPLLVATALLLVPCAARAADEKPDASATPTRPAERSVSIQAILISASNEKVPTDKRLAALEANLKRSLRFESFQYLGEGTARIEMPASASIALPQEQEISVEAAYYGEGVVWLRVIWNDGGRQFMNVVYSKCTRGRPIVVGGLNKGGENLAIIVTPR